MLLKFTIVGLVSLLRGLPTSGQKKEPGENCRVPRVTLSIHSEGEHQPIITGYHGILFINYYLRPCTSIVRTDCGQYGYSTFFLKSREREMRVCGPGYDSSHKI